MVSQQNLPLKQEFAHERDQKVTLNRKHSLKQSKKDSFSWKYALFDP